MTRKVIKLVGGVDRMLDRVLMWFTRTMQKGAKRQWQQNLIVVVIVAAVCWYFRGLL